MTAYTFDAVKGTTIAFDPAVDTLFFGGSGRHAAQLRFQAVGADLQVWIGNDYVVFADTTYAELGSGDLLFEDLSSFQVGGNDVDTLYGTSRADYLDGRGGNDVLIGRAGDDTYIVDSASDYVSEAYAGGVDTVRALVSYSLGANVENLWIRGTGAVNGTGNPLANTIISGAGDNVINGAGGVDTVSYLGATGGINVWLALTTAQATGGSGNDTLRNLENVIGSAFADVLRGNGLANRLDGGGGSDTLTGSGGLDTLVGNAGDDRLTGDADHDSLYGSQGNDWLDGGLGDDEVDGGSGSDTLHGGDGNDRLSNTLESPGSYYVDDQATDGNEMHGGNGNDTLYGDRGMDTLFGDAGNDWLKLFIFGGPGWMYGGDGDDSLEGTTGGDFANGGADNDTIRGDSGNDTLHGGGGSDNVHGGDGDDFLTQTGSEGARLEGDDGNDTLVGGDGADQLYAAALYDGSTDCTDSLYGGLGDDTLYASNGADRLAGGGGNDTASFFYVSVSGLTGVSVNLALVSPQDTGYGLDALVGIENVIGTAYSDQLRGNGLANRIDGGSGNGIDWLLGGGGADVMIGGAGADLFVYASPSDSSGAAIDTIVDFSHTQGDRIDLQRIDADAVTAGNQAFVFIGAAAFSADATGQLRYEAGVLYASVDADADVEFSIVLTGAPALVAGDFVL